MLLATWNVNSLKARFARVSEWIADVRPDVLMMQETKMADAAFPTDAFAAAGYESVHFGEGRWNGVVILSRVGLEAPRANFVVGEPDTQARVVSAVCGGMTVVCVYVPNGRALDDDHYQYKLRFMAQLRDHVAALADPGSDVVIGGDFNIAPTDADVWDPAALAGQTHVSAPERESLGRILDWGVRDVVREAHPQPGLYSWWDYRNGSFHRGWGMRIDLLLASESVAKRTTWAAIDRNARKGEQPSDHAPVLMDVAPR